MAIDPIDKKVVLERTELSFENQAVLNPACVRVDGITHMLYRAVHEGNYSSIGYAQLKGDEVVYRSDEPVLKPQYAYEQHGLEDPRIIEIDGAYHIFYTVFDGEDAQVAYGVGKEIPHFRKHGVISPRVSFHELRERCQEVGRERSFSFFCQTHLPFDAPDNGTLLWEKDVFAFPKRIRGKIALVHRIRPDIQIIYCDELEDLSKRYWMHYLAHLETGVLLKQVFPFENGYIGGGAPPVETEKGWLLIYHGVDNAHVYRAGAALLDLHHPENVIARLPYPLFSPEEEWEKVGDVANVVFPTAAIAEGDRIDIYYGAADKRIARISYNLPNLLEEIMNFPAVE